MSPSLRWKLSAGNISGFSDIRKKTFVLIDMAALIEQLRFYIPLDTKMGYFRDALPVSTVSWHVLRKQNTKRYTKNIYTIT